MDQNEFEHLNHLSDMAYEKFEALYASGALSELEQELHKVSLTLADKFTVSLELHLTVYDAQREKSLSLLTTGLTSGRPGNPYRTSGDSTVHRYVVDGFIRVVPHDYCPHCWASWDFKLINRTCPDCGYSLGNQVKLLLDTDVCPHCELGQVTRMNPTCTHCSFTVDPDIVVWG